jgi:very-short-patch-repair endonuclease
MIELDPKRRAEIEALIDDHAELLKAKAIDEMHTELICVLDDVESPIEALLGAHLLLQTDGYNRLKFYNAFGAQGWPDFGTAFGCQIPVGKYRADFLFRCCYGADFRLLVVECDGHDYHERTKEQAARDRSRDRAMTLSDIKVLRFTGSEIHRDPAGCAEQVSTALGNLIDDMLADDGQIRRRKPRPDGGM